MNKLLFAVAAYLSMNVSSFSQTVQGREAEAKIKGAEMIQLSQRSSYPEFVEFSESPSYRKGGIKPQEVIHNLFNLSNDDHLVAMKTTHDKLGFTHTRYQQYYKNIPVEGGEYIAHERSGGLDCINGLLFKMKNNISVTPVITEAQALKKAITYVGAKKYMWENKAHIAELRKAFNNPNFNFTPIGTLVIYPKGNVFKESADFRLAYKFNIYAEEPLSRANIFVDAKTGEIIGRLDLLESADVVGTAHTMYSGTRQITTDQVSSNSYRLRETGRGGGIQTMNAKKSTSTAGAVDFTDTDNDWNNVNANVDQAATDAHWATELTYDFYKQKFNRNSIDDQGFKLINYVHWDQNLFNAYWNGQYMVYGDGSNGNMPLTAVDVGAHEMTHGLTSSTAKLNYQGESGALNESFSDIFGSCVENFGKGAAGMWTVGEDFQTIRDMKNPNSFSDPDTYKGTYWATGSTDNGGVHTNSGVQNKWFYILTVGEAGTNDNNQQYNVTGIGVDKSAQIVYRTLTMYLTSNSDYANTRTMSLKAATDLFGNCSPEYIATTDAWYAVGVGAQANCQVAPVANFVANITTSCNGIIQFTDKSSSSPTSWAWDFGDGQTSTIQNPVHTYTSNGTFTVKLTATNAYGNNSVTKTAYITINLITAPSVTNSNRCNPGVVNLAATGTGTLQWYDAATGGNLVNTGTTYSPNLNATTTYYVEASSAAASQKVGPADASIGASAYLNTAGYGLLFDVLSPCIIKSVKVDAQVAGNRTIQVVSGGASGTTVVQSTTVKVPAGVSRVALNFNIPVGTQYYMKVSSDTIQLKRNSAGAIYPYTLSGLLSITNSNGSSGYYYYFYDWEVAEQGCTSSRTPVTGTIAPLIKPIITLISSNVLSAPAGYTYQWYLNGNPIAGATGQTYTMTQSGDYTVEITETLGNCKAISDPFTYTTGIEEKAALSSVNIYPNPSNGMLYLNSPKLDKKAEVSVYSLVGEKLYSNTYNLLEQTQAINLSSFADGVYFIRLQIGNDYSTFKFTLQH